MPPSSAILFDLDDTLFDRQALIPEYLQLLDGRGHAPRQPFFAAWPGGTDQARFSQWLCSQLSPDGELLEVLAGLPHKALISNGGGPTQRAKLAALGLDRVFSQRQIYISGELEWQKPDPRIFQFACGQHGWRPQDCCYVGDQPDLDGLGARAAGLRFVQVERALNGPRLQELLRNLPKPKA